MILTCCVGFALGMQDRFPGSLLNFVMNVCLIKSTYVGAFWFVQTYTIHQYVVDTHAVLWDIYTNTCILFKECVCDYVDTCRIVVSGILCGRLDL